MSHASELRSARASLTRDSDGDLTLTPGVAGTYHFLGVPSGSRVATPGVTEATTVDDAADEVLNRYGSAFGADRPGSTFVAGELTHNDAGGSVVRYQQEVGGVPVFGGELVMTLDADHQLSSILSDTSSATSVTAPSVAERDAREIATDAVADQFHATVGDLDVTPLGRWLVDPTLLGDATQTAVRTAWRFEVGVGDAVQQLLMVDDRTGQVLMDLDENDHLNRVVCDDGDTPRTKPESATCPDMSHLVRWEGQPPTSDPDATNAYENAKVVSDFYQAVGGMDLTQLIGRDVGNGVKAIAQTVHFCFGARDGQASNCPDMHNAFWNPGTRQMYYGNGYPGALDVVGHEMTHGVTEQLSGLWSFGQPGAVNEAMSDIMGELIEHRVNPGLPWIHAEQAPSAGSAMLGRSMADPTRDQNPDRMTSPYYRTESCCTFPDHGGVHRNLGVGDHAAYLISQGGTFNNQTITGIDAGDPTLTKSAQLWLLVDQSLASGSDYADLARVLDQSCQSLLASGKPGFTAATCTAVHQAVVATEMSLPPRAGARPADAPDTCAGGTKRILLDSESGDPTSSFAPTSGRWTRSSTNAHSNPADWRATEPSSAGTSSLLMRQPLQLPANQASFLRFEQWRLLDYAVGSAGTIANYDAGTVELSVDGRAPTDAARMPWVNGPADVVYTGTANPAAGRLAFGNDSHGYVASRLDLSGLAGHRVTAQFSLNTDSAAGAKSWFLDDIVVYTCDGAPLTTLRAGKPTIRGKAIVGRRLSARSGTWQPANVVLSYQWLRNGHAIRGATARRYVVAKKDKGSKISVVVTGTSNGVSASATSARTKRVKATVRRHHP